MHHIKWDTLPERLSVSGLPIKVAHGEQITATLVELPAGFQNQPHSHPSEQFGYVLSGEVIYDIEGQIIICQAGDSYLIPPNILHGIRVSATSPAHLLEVFCPPRSEYKPDN